MKRALTITQQEKVKKQVFRHLASAGFAQQDKFWWIQIGESLRLCLRGPFVVHPNHQDWTVQTWDTKAQAYPSLGMSGSTSIGSMWADTGKVFDLLFSKAYQIGYQIGRTTERSHTKIAIQPLLMILQKL